eukprot:CAMPEP_0168423206 /NCGR_PEP_ID=MMETSP0228-20121227/34190_1 /TAXON_ID=133427 /ORGANISM="Protoceratium reticulatum, Strain CCCM 535 (=CCMP 1889)" /LENGTH=213 /DNA_ID=CAMNT_0008437163 /DNA_START=76 /DNA_END=713 /DNA_ORIENTATION=+
MSDAQRVILLRGVRGEDVGTRHIRGRHCLLHIQRCCPQLELDIHGWLQAPEAPPAAVERPQGVPHGHAALGQRLRGAGRQDLQVHLGRGGVLQETVKGIVPLKRKSPAPILYCTLHQIHVLLHDVRYLRDAQALLEERADDLERALVDVARRGRVPPQRAGPRREGPALDGDAHHGAAPAAVPGHLIREAEAGVQLCRKHEVRAARAPQVLPR